MNNAEKIQAVINTLDLIEVKASYDNTNRLLGIHKTLMEVRDELIMQMQEVKENAGEADAE